MSIYDSIADLYDPWSRTVVEDVGFYVEEARAAGGPIVELGVGTGRVAVPTALAGVPLIGVDSSERMLTVCRQRSERFPGSDRVELLSTSKSPITKEATHVNGAFGPRFFISAANKRCKIQEASKTSGLALA